MEFIIGGRQQGKTTKLLEWMREAPPGTARVMICNSDEVAQKMWEYQERGPNLLKREQFQSLEEFKLRKHATRLNGMDIELAVDDVAHILCQALGTWHPIERVAGFGTVDPIEHSLFERLTLENARLKSENAKLLRTRMLLTNRRLG